PAHPPGLRGCRARTTGRRRSLESVPEKLRPEVARPEPLPPALRSHKDRTPRYKPLAPRKRKGPAKRRACRFGPNSDGILRERAGFVLSVVRAKIRQMTHR